MPIALNAGTWLMFAQSALGNLITNAIVGALIVLLLVLLYTEISRSK